MEETAEIIENAQEITAEYIDYIAEIVDKTSEVSQATQMVNLYFVFVDFFFLYLGHIQPSCIAIDLFGSMQTLNSVLIYSCLIQMEIFYKRKVNQIILSNYETIVCNKLFEYF